MAGGDGDSYGFTVEGRGTDGCKDGDADYDGRKEGVVVSESCCAVGKGGEGRSSAVML